MQTGDREMPLFAVRRALFAIQRHLLEIAAAPESAFLCGLVGVCEIAVHDKMPTAAIKHLRRPSFMR